MRNLDAAIKNQPKPGNFAPTAGELRASVHTSHLCNVIPAKSKHSKDSERLCWVCCVEYKQHVVAARRSNLN